MRSALSCDITQCVVVIPYRSFGTTYRSHLQWPRNPRRRISWPLKKGPLCCTGTSVRNCHYTLRKITEERRSHLFSCFKMKKLLGWIHTCNVTASRNTVSWQCARDLCTRNVSKVGYAVTLRACSVCRRYLVVASNGWYGYGRSRCGRATSRWNRWQWL